MILHYYKAQGYTPKLGKRSLANLDSCENDLQVVAHQIIEWGYDISIVYGHRNEEDQNECFVNKRSKLCWPNSKHNFMPSRAGS